MYNTEKWADVWNDYRNCQNRTMIRHDNGEWSKLFQSLLLLLASTMAMQWRVMKELWKHPCQHNDEWWKISQCRRADHSCPHILANKQTQLALFDISIWHIDCRYIDTFEKSILISILIWSFLKISISILISIRQFWKISISIRQFQKYRYRYRYRYGDFGKYRYRYRYR